MYIDSIRVVESEKGCRSEKCCWQITSLYKLIHMRKSILIVKGTFRSQECKESHSLILTEGKFYQGIHSLCRLTIPCLIRAQDGQGVSLPHLFLCRHFAIIDSIIGSQNYVGWRSGGYQVQHTPPTPLSSRANLYQIAHEFVP